MNTEKSRSTLNVLFYIKKQKLLKTGEAPICMRITIDKRKQEIMIKRSIPVGLWDQKKESSKGKDRAAKELNHYLDTTKAKVLAIHHDLLEEGVEVTAESVRDRFYGRDSSKHTLLTIYAEQNRKCRELIGRDYAESTVKKFDTAINRLREFITERFHKEDVPLDKVTGEFIRDFDFWLKTERKMQNNSALKHLKELKKVMRIALANGWIKKDPFYGIRLRRDEVNVEFLSREELETLINGKAMIESIPEFYRRIGEHNFSVADYSKEKPYFSVQPCRCRIGHTSFSYREFYKVTLVLGEGKLIDAIFGEYCEKHLIQPVFITDYPVSMSPLTKRHRSNPDLTERFELFVCGKELANAYSELNDPIDQLERFEDQLKQREHGDDEAMYIDMDFVRALEYGMPPTSGMGMGIDRLTMFMTNSPTIQDVLFFPQMRPKKAQGQDTGKKEE